MISHLYIYHSTFLTVNHSLVDRKDHTQNYAALLLLCANILFCLYHSINTHSLTRIGRCDIP